MERLRVLALVDLHRSGTAPWRAWTWSCWAGLTLEEGRIGDVRAH